MRNPPSPVLQPSRYSGPLIHPLRLLLRSRRSTRRCHKSRPRSPCLISCLPSTRSSAFLAEWFQSPQLLSRRRSPLLSPNHRLLRFRLRSKTRRTPRVPLPLFKALRELCQMQRARGMPLLPLQPPRVTGPLRPLELISLRLLRPCLPKSTRRRSRPATRSHLSAQSTPTSVRKSIAADPASQQRADHYYS